jgi:hypothetical protein
MMIIIVQHIVNKPWVARYEYVIAPVERLSPLVAVKG